MRPETVWLLIYSSKYKKNQLNTFENGKTELFNSGGSGKMSLFPKKVEYPFNIAHFIVTLTWMRTRGCQAPTKTP